MSGYKHSTREWEFDCVAVLNKLTAAGKQLTIQRSEKGPIIHIQAKHNHVAHGDLLKIEKFSGEQIFEVGSDGNICVNGRITFHNDAVFAVTDLTTGGGDFVDGNGYDKGGVIIKRDDVNVTWKISINSYGNLTLQRYNEETNQWVEKHCFA